MANDISPFAGKAIQVRGNGFPIGSAQAIQQLEDHCDTMNKTYIGRWYFVDRRPPDPDGTPGKHYVDCHMVEFDVWKRNKSQRAYHYTAR